MSCLLTVAYFFAANMHAPLVVCLSFDPADFSKRADRQARTRRKQHIGSPEPQAPLQMGVVNPFGYKGVPIVFMQ